MLDLCQYKSIFGNPSEGVHSTRIFGVAAVDLILTILAAIMISRYFKTDLFKTTLIIFIIGILAHRLFCVNTTINKLIFGTV
jgi:hypothetical protein